MSTSVAEPPKSGRWLKVVEGVIWLVLGLFLISNPAATAQAVAKLIGVFLLVLGFYLFARIFARDRDIGWGWLLAGGLLSVLTGVITLENPATAAFLTGSILVLAVASAIMVLGIVMIASGRGAFGTIAGIAIILVGVVLVFNPLGTMASLPIIAGILSLVAGVATIIRAFTGPKAQAA